MSEKKFKVGDKITTPEIFPNMETIIYESDYNYKVLNREDKVNETKYYKMFKDPNDPELLKQMIVLLMDRVKKLEQKKPWWRKL